MQLKRDLVKGEAHAGSVAFTVGREVRRVMTQDGSPPPEHLRLAGDIKHVKSGLKKAAREMQRLDSPKRPKKKSHAPTI